MINVARGRQFFQHVLPAIIRPLRVLWNQVIGFFFLVIALWAVPRTVSSLREFNGEPSSLFRLILSVLFIGLMAGYGIYSFWRARKVPKAKA